MSAHVMLTTRLKAYKEKERIQQNVERKRNKDRKKVRKKERVLSRVNSIKEKNSFYKRKKILFNKFNKNQGIFYKTKRNKQKKILLLWTFFLFL